MPRAAAAAVASRLPRARARPRIVRPLLFAILGLVLLAAGYLALRESPLVRVERVSVTGLTGPDAPKIERLLTAAARDMSTLGVDEGQLRDVTAPFPVVEGLSARPDFPHGLRIDVRENTPVAILAADGVRVPVGGDGTLLPGAATRDLPLVALPTAPAGARLADRTALASVRVLAAAPEPLRARATRAQAVRGGVVVTLAHGPALRFGGAERLAAKWASAVAVLGDASSAGASYLDLRYPERPAPGGLEDPAGQLSPDAANSATQPTPAAPDAATAATTP